MSIFSTPAGVLFDIRSSRSFVSIIFVLHATRELVSLNNKLIVNTPLGEQILHTLVFKGCKIVVEGIVLRANLIPLEMSDFDVILRMDWLSKHNAVIDCFSKIVTFKKSRDLEFTFQGERKILSSCLISIMTAKRYLRKGILLTLLM